MKIDSRQLSDTQPAVLVIDDSQDVHRLLRARLRTEGLTLRHAEGGEVGLEAIATDAPSLVLLDLDMPGMDGFEVLRRIKDNVDTVDLPVIVLSGMSNSHDKVTAFDLGAVDYITKPFDMSELRVRIGAALRTAQLVQMLAQRAQIDGLTGLWNRAYFDERWDEQISGNQRHGRPLSLALFDADHFKSVNDTYGHPAGDHVLQGIAKVLQRECRQTDIPARYGGEEFALIMPDTPPDEAEKVCDRIRASLEEVVWPRHPERAITLSAGVAGVEGKASINSADWLEAADKNLYTAKQTGRNRVSSSCLPSAEPKLADAG